MTRFLIPIALAAALAGCATPATTPTASTATSEVAAVIAGVQKACQVTPYAADIANLIPIYGASAGAIITAVCAAVNAAAQVSTLTLFGLPGAHAPVIVHGVTIRFQ